MDIFITLIEHGHKHGCKFSSFILPRQLNVSIVKSELLNLTSAFHLMFNNVHPQWFHCLKIFKIIIISQGILCNLVDTHRVPPQRDCT